MQPQHLILVIYDLVMGHPELSGSYLTANVLFTVMFNKSPLGADSPADIFDVNATDLQQIASDQQLDSDGDDTATFPTDNSETKDSDGDRTGDNAVPYPNDSINTPTALPPVIHADELPDLVNSNCLSFDKIKFNVYVL